jgi:hypothetical protein
MSDCKTKVLDKCNFTIDNTPPPLTRKQLIKLVNYMKNKNIITDIDITNMTDDEIITRLVTNS